MCHVDIGLKSPSLRLVPKIWPWICQLSKRWAFLWKRMVCLVLPGDWFKHTHLHDQVTYFSPGNWSIENMRVSSPVIISLSTIHNSWQAYTFHVLHLIQLQKPGLLVWLLPSWKGSRLRKLRLAIASCFLSLMKPLEWDSFLECLQDSKVVFEASLPLCNFRIWGFELMLNWKNAGSLPCKKVVWSVIQKDAMGVLECSASLKPSHTTHVTSKGATFFPWNGPWCFIWSGVCLLLGVLWFCLNNMAQNSISQEALWYQRGK